MNDPAWDVFMLGLDRDAVAREWAPPLEQVISERPKLDPASRDRIADVQYWREVYRAEGRVQAAVAEVERIAQRKAAEARELRAFQVNRMKYRKAA